MMTGEQVGRGDASEAGATRRLRSEPRLGARGLTFALLAACLIPLCGLSIYAIIAGGAYDKPLPVEVAIDVRPVELASGGGAVLAPVVVIRNLADFEIPRLTIDINGQYFLHQDAPLQVGEELVLPQEIFSTKSNQRWKPGAYPITEINVTGQLPSRARGVLEWENSPVVETPLQP